MLSDNPTAQQGDLVQLVSPSNKVFFVRLYPGGELQTHRGVLKFDDIIGQPWGTEILSHQGRSFYLLQPSLSELIQETRRNSQIIYPKDIGYILVNLSIGPGKKVIEAGTGSGAFTTALAWMVGDQGCVYSYETRQDMQNLAKKNIDRLDLSGNVQFRLRDIAEGFNEEFVDAVFLDLPNPYDYIGQVRSALKPGGHFGAIVPTVNQLERLLPALHNYQFSFIDIVEILLRHYKPLYQRLRPTDRMVAHTGYLVFARSVSSAQQG